MWISSKSNFSPSGSALAKVFASTAPTTVTRVKGAIEREATDEDATKGFHVFIFVPSLHLQQVEFRCHRGGYSYVYGFQETN